MTAANVLYVQGLYQRFAYLATWLPNMKLALGDVGIQQAGGFKRLTSLRDLKLAFETRAGESPVDFTYTSEAGITVRTKAAGEIAAGTTLPLGQAGILIEFSQQGAFLFQAIGCYVDEIEDRVRLGQAVIRLHQKGLWEPNWSVVDTLVKADNVTIVVSNSRRASLELTAKTPALISNLANADTGLAVNAQQGDLVQFLAARGLAPLFKLSRLKKSILASLLGASQPILFGGPTPSEEAETDENVLEAVAPEFPKPRKGRRDRS